MADTPLEDYALLTDRRTSALVSREGSIDWLCLPRYDSAAVFARLLGDVDNGRWLLEVVDGEVTSREYVEDTFVLRTTWRGPRGEAVVTELLPRSDDHSDLIRHVEVTAGEVTVRHELLFRFGYGARTSWVRRVTTDEETMLVAIAGADALALRGPLLHAEDHRHGGEFTLGEGDSATWSLAWFPSHEDPPPSRDPGDQIEAATDDWQRWASQIETGHDDPAVRRSLLVLRALTHHATGGIVAAPTTSLPEQWGGERNWDYRYVWLRDSALAIEAMLAHGLRDRSWRDWLLRAIAGDSQDLRIMYGIGGEHVADETEVEHLRGYEDSRPVRVGNGAAEQYQADVVGEVMIALSRLRDEGVAEDAFSWGLQRAMLAYCERHIDDKDHGIWEMRGDLHHFTHGRVMLWAAFDRGIAAVEEHGLHGDVERWRALRERLRTEIDEHGYDDEIGSFTQTYETTDVDASLLVIPHTGYCAWDDPRMLGTVARIEEQLLDEHGLLHRYRTDAGRDGLEGEEYPFLLCCFWLVESYARTGRLVEAEEMYQRLVSLGGELSLLAEEYDPARGRLAGNYPQAFSHLGLVEAAEAIREAKGAGSPARRRS